MAKEDWITQEQLAESLRVAFEGDRNTSFMKQYQGEWEPSARRCMNRSTHDQCPNEAKFTLIRDPRREDEGLAKDVCDRCLAPVLMAFRSGEEFMVIKL